MRLTIHAEILPSVFLISRPLLLPLSPCTLISYFYWNRFQSTNGQLLRVSLDEIRTTSVMCPTEISNREEVFSEEPYLTFFTLETNSANIYYVGNCDPPLPPSMSGRALKATSLNFVDTQCILGVGSPVQTLDSFSNFVFLYLQTDPPSQQVIVYDILNPDASPSVPPSGGVINILRLYRGTKQPLPGNATLQNDHKDMYSTCTVLCIYDL